MPRYNRRKSRFNWERAIQGAVSGAATGGSVAGPKGAVVGAFTGGVTGGLTGRDTSIDRAPYDRAIGEFSQLRRRRARVAADEHGAQSGAAFQRRGLNTSELAAGAISANRGRFMRDAETDIATFAADINLRIAQAEQQAEMADDELTRQGWLDLAGQLGLMAISGEFSNTQVSEGMLASLRASHPDEVNKWLSGTLSDEDLVGIYTRYGKLHGEPGTMQRRFSDLENNVGAGQGPVPEANLPTGERARSWSGMHAAIKRLGGGKTTEGGEQGESGESVNIEGKPIMPIEPGDSEIVRMVKRTIPKDDFEVLEALEPDLRSLLTGDTPADVKPNLTTSWQDTRDTRTETPVESMPADEPLWHSDFLSQQTDEKLLDMLDAMETEIANPNQTDAFKQRAQQQIALIGQEIQNRMWPGGADAGTSGADVNLTQAWQNIKNPPSDTTIVNFRDRRRQTPVEPPSAERRGKPNPLPSRQQRADTSMRRFR